jgi:hypothetical protein
MTLIVLCLSLTPCAATGEWNARPTGYTLTEDSVVGSIEDGRKVVEKVKGMEGRIDLQDAALASMEERVRIVSLSLAEAQGQIAEVPDLLKKAETEFQTQITRERRRGTVAILVVAAVALALH